MRTSHERIEMLYANPETTGDGRSRVPCWVDERTSAPSFSQNTNTSADWRGSRAAHQCIVCPTSLRAGDGTERYGPGLGVSWVHENYLLFERLCGNAYFDLRAHRLGWNEVAHFGPIDTTSTPPRYRFQAPLGQ